MKETSHNKTVMNEYNCISSSPGDRSINDALLVDVAGEPRFSRVVAITPDGRCVIDVGVGVSSDGLYLRLEKEPGELPKVGFYVKEYDGILQWLFGSPEWRFIPVTPAQ